MVMSGRSVNLPTLFLGRVRPPERLTSTLCTYFRQKPTTALFESAEGETKVCGRTGYRTRDLWLLNRCGVRVHILTDQIGGGGYGDGRGGWAEVDCLRVVVIRLRDARFSP